MRLLRSIPVKRVGGLIALVLCVSIILPLGLIAGDDEDGYPPITLQNTEMRQLTSGINGVTYHLFIKLPAGYDQSDTTYPTMYITDPNLVFPMIYNFSNLYSGMMPEMLIVGIGYRTDGMQHWMAGRRRDMTLASSARGDSIVAGIFKSRYNMDEEIIISSGGAEKFLRFIKEELIPFVEDEYRVDPEQRTMAGYSRGGMFSLYALFKEPDLFQKYFAGSPSIGGGSDTLMFDYEQEYAETHDDLPVRLFLSVGENESENMLNGFHRMDERLRSREYPSFEYKTRVIGDANHTTGVPTATTFALEFLYHTEEEDSSGGE